MTPFGMTIKERSWSDTSFNYRFGFNGQEGDDEINGQGNSLDFGARIYDSRLGRFFSSDPFDYLAPQYSPYIISINNPIYNIDIDGEYGKGYIDKDGKLHITVTYSYVNQGPNSFTDVQIESLECQFNTVYSEAVGMKVEIDGREYEIGSVTAEFTAGGTWDNLVEIQKENNTTNILANASDQKMKKLDNKTKDEESNLLGRTSSENGGSNNLTWIRGSSIESANIMADEAGHTIGMWHPHHGFTRDMVRRLEIRAITSGYIGEAERMAYVNFSLLTDPNINYSFGDLMLMKQQWSGNGGNNVPNLSLADMQMAIDGKHEKSLEIDLSKNKRKGKRVRKRKSDKYDKKKVYSDYDKARDARDKRKK